MFRETARKYFEEHVKPYHGMQAFGNSMGKIVVLSQYFATTVLHCASITKDERLSTVIFQKRFCWFTRLRLCF